MKRTYAQQAATIVRMGDYDNASALYVLAAHEADKRGEHAKANIYFAKSVRYLRMDEARKYAEAAAEAINRAIGVSK